MSNDWLHAWNEGAGLWAAGMGRACWQGALFFLVVWAICRGFPRLPAGARCWLWWLASLKLLVGLTWWTPLTFSVLPAPPGAETALRFLTPPVPPRTQALTLTRVDDSQGKVVARPTGSVVVSQPALTPGWVGLLLGLWLALVAGRLLKAGRQLLLVQRLLRSARRLPHTWLSEHAERLAVALGLRRAPPIREAPGVPGPLVAGMFRPMVLLPESAAERFSPTELRMALAHELAHVRRGDLLLSWVPQLAQALFFFFPPAVLAVREWAMAREAACDEAALAATGEPPAAYGRLLLKLAAGHRQPAALPALGASAGYQTLQRRLRMLPRNTLAHRRGWRVGLTALLAVGAVSVIPWRLIARAAPAGAPKVELTMVATPAVDEGMIARCSEQLRALGRAMQAYQRDHGDPPAHLSDLFPKYVADLQALHCPADRTEGSQRPEYDWTDETAPPNDPRPVSYAYYLSPANTRVTFGGLGIAPLDKEDRSWRGLTLGQREMYGDRVPAARCWHHAPSGHAAYTRPLVLSLALDGSVYRGGGNWRNEPASVAAVVERMERDLASGPTEFRKRFASGGVAAHLTWIALESDPVTRQVRAKLGAPFHIPPPVTAELRDRLRSLARQVESTPAVFRATDSRPDRLAMIGALYDAAGDTEKAVAAYEGVAVRMQKNQPMFETGEIAVKHRLPELYSARGQHERAIRYYQRLVAKDPEKWDHYIELAREYEAIGKFKEATALRERWDPSGLLLNKPAPAFEAKDQAGAPVSMAMLRARVVVLFFRDSRYPRLELIGQQLDALQRQYRAQGLSVLYLARQADAEAALRQIPAGHSYPVVTSADSVFRQYGVHEGSMLFVVDKQGKVAHRYTGYGLDEGAERWLEREVKKLLAPVQVEVEAVLRP